MNPQYSSQQQFPQSMPGFQPTGRMPPAGPQSFQNIPLGPQKMQTQNGPPQTGIPSHNIPSSQPGQFSPIVGPQGLSSRPIPSSQLPPLSAQNQMPSSNQFAPPSANKGSSFMNLTHNLQNGPPPQFPSSTQLRGEPSGTSNANVTDGPSQGLQQNQNKPPVPGMFQQPNQHFGSHIQNHSDQGSGIPGQNFNSLTGKPPLQPTKTEQNPTAHPSNAKPTESQTPSLNNLNPSNENHQFPHLPRPPMSHQKGADPNADRQSNSPHLITQPLGQRPSTPGQNNPPNSNSQNQLASSNAHPSQSGLNRPPLPGQGENQLQQPGQGSLSGQPQVPLPGQSQGSLSAQLQGSLPGQSQMGISGQSQASLPDHPEPSLPGQFPPPFSKQPQSRLPGQNQPPFPGQNQTPFPSQNQPQIPGQPPISNQFAPHQGSASFMSQSTPRQGPPPSSVDGPPHPSTMQGPPPNSLQRPPPSSMQGPPPSSMQGPLSSLQRPLPGLIQGAPPASMQGAPPASMQGAPPTSMQLPTLPSLSGRKQKSPYQLHNDLGYPASKPPGMGMSPQSNQFGQPPKPGQPPAPNQFGQDAPGSFQAAPNQFGHGPPGSFGGNMPPPPSQMNQPTLPGQFNSQNQYNSANQLSNQMQSMSLGGGRPYPGAPSGGTMNGDDGPHMAPFGGSQQGYLNGQQMRGPQSPGYPGQGYPGQGGFQGAGYTGQGLAMHGGMGSAYSQAAYAQQQQKKLDPDHMPNPISVTEDDQQSRSGIFCTNQKGLVPPLVTTKFIVQDQGNCSPRFIRSTMYTVPTSQDMMKQTAVPFSLVISPMARTLDQEYPPPIVNFGELGPVRCIRCKAYMCPFMQFVDSGRRFQCLFCKATTDVPQEYFQHLDHTGQRMDRYERPELVLGTYEFVGTADYCKNNVLPKPPAIIFVIDVSYNNIKSGLVHLLCAQMKEIIKHLPVDQGHEKSNMKVGFITYNSSVHFYNIKGTLAAPQMLVVGDTQEMFMPLLDGFLCTPEESGSIIDQLMQQIPQMFGATRETETVLLPAILAGLEALKASECAGKLMVFHSSLPVAEAPGKLKNRDDRKLLGTDKEKTILTPQNQAYNNLGQDCVSNGCCVDLFLFNNAYIDIATIGQVSRLTGGEIFKYTYFQADLDGDRLIQDIITDISRPIAFDAIMRVRTSTGVRPTEFYGHFYMQNTTDMEFAAIDCDKAVGVEIKHDDKLSEDEGVYIQSALLYTSCSGQRRLRIMNLSLRTSSQMSDLFRSCDLDTIINYISKQSVFKLLEHSPKAVKENIVTRGAQILATYRKQCATPGSAGQLILPECMKLLPLYVGCLLKSDAISGGPDMTVDDRSFVMQAVMIMDVPTSVNYVYPRVIPLHEVDPTSDPVELPSPVRCTMEKLSEQGVYILENGIHMFLWIGLNASPEFVNQVFGVQSAMQVDIERNKLPELDNPLSLAVRTVIDEMRIDRHRCMRLTLVRPREKLEPVFKHFLVEDRGADGSPNYVDFLCHMHKEIRSLLS